MPLYQFAHLNTHYSQIGHQRTGGNLSGLDPCIYLGRRSDAKTRILVLPPDNIET